MLRRDFNKLLCLLPITGGSLFGSNTSTIEQELVYHQQDYLHPFFRAFKTNLLIKAKEQGLTGGKKGLLAIFSSEYTVIRGDIHWVGEDGFGFSCYVNHFLDLDNLNDCFRIDAKLAEIPAIEKSIPKNAKLKPGLSLPCTEIPPKKLAKIHFHLLYLVYSDPDLSKVYRLI